MATKFTDIDAWNAAAASIAGAVGPTQIQGFQNFAYTLNGLQVAVWSGVEHVGDVELPDEIAAGESVQESDIELSTEGLQNPPGFGPEHVHAVNPEPPVEPESPHE